MVRCCKCNQSFRTGTGKSWRDAKMCHKCWREGRDIKYIPTNNNSRLTDTPMDFYLDQYTNREIKNIDNDN